MTLHRLQTTSRHLCRPPALVCGLSAALVMLAAAPAGARPAYPRAVADAFGPVLPVRSQACATCHAEPGSKEPRFNLQLPRPHNSFGARVAAAGETLKKAGRPFDIAARLALIASEDSDADGIPNRAELILGRNPGARRDRPSAADLKRLPGLVTALIAWQGRHQWRPFEEVRRPTPPRLPGITSSGNPIDAFVGAEYAAYGVRPRPLASRETLIRRVTLDLTGLPPTREEVSAFLADRSPDAYARTVDRLLASPRYGERWGRHWMDVWRYSDWDGFGEEVRNSHRHIWRWRDWIIQSLNADKGYDRMVQEMLAGDELEPENPAALAATGFLVRNWYVFSRHETLTKVIEHTGKAFLGITMNCARCHDHKFDPISQAEYFNFQAFFEAQDVRIDRVPGEPNPAKAGLARIYDARPDEPTYFLNQGDDRKPDKTKRAAPGLPALFGVGPMQIQPVSLPTSAVTPDRRPFVIEETLAAERAALEAARAAVQRAVAAGDGDAAVLAELSVSKAATSLAALESVLAVEKLEDEKQRESAAWRVAATAAQSAQRRAALAAAEFALAVERRSLAGMAQKPGMPAPAQAQIEAAEKKVAAAEGSLTTARAALLMPSSTAYTPRVTTRFPAASTGRRLALARWITDRRNPLAARVAVNHMWARHFGQPLVPTVFDFGANGRPASHPALLDWLASELMDHGWSMKHVHRLMVTSRAYRQESTWDAAAARVDPDNRLLWRMNPRRMEAEVVRDSLLSLSGRLDLTAGGPDLDQGLAESVPRRSLYFRHSVEKRVLFLETFDQGSVAECYQRDESIVPQQALALANSRLAATQSRLLARSLAAGIGAADRGAPTGLVDRPLTDLAFVDLAFIDLAFRHILGRSPTSGERTECRAFLVAQTARLRSPGGLTLFGGAGTADVPPSEDPALRARESLIRVLFNHNDFVTIR